MEHKNDKVTKTKTSTSQLNMGFQKGWVKLMNVCYVKSITKIIPIKKCSTPGNISNLITDIHFTNPFCNPDFIYSLITIQSPK